MLPSAARHPYADAPRLPEGDVVSPAQFLVGTGPVELEIGPGRGGFILERLEGDPRVRIFGLEIRRKWATLVDRKIEKRGHAGRGRVFAEDARVALPRLASATLDRIYLHFPDPWWKKRHQKRLLASDDLAGHAARLVVPGGDVFVQTDVEERAELYRELLARHPHFEPCDASQTWATDPGFGARSPRERRALEDHLPVYRVHFRRL